MQRVKIIIKRPTIHYIISLGYILAHSGLILLDYILKWTRLPRYYWISIPAVHQILIFVGNMALIVAIGYIIQKDFRSPYFQVLPRSWRKPVPCLPSCNSTDYSNYGLSWRCLYTSL